jgi:hypothetical protein
MFNAELYKEKWKDIIESADASPITDPLRRAVTTLMLEQQQRACREERGQSTFLAEDGSGQVNTALPGASNWDPVLISLVRRAMPNLIAYDVAGVQPMNQPTGLIFAMRSKYLTPTAGGDASTEAFMAKPNTAFSGPVTTAQGEALINSSAHASGKTVAGGGFGNMGFTIDKATVTAQTRALKADYTMELAQDLKAVHGLDAETELANILSTEILAEINREILVAINTAAVVGAEFTTDPGTFDLQIDADGRWAVERFKSLVFQLELEANAIAKATRRGKGNNVICSSNVASALAAAGVLDYTPALSTNLQVDDTGNTFAGVLNGRLKVWVDPYAETDYITVVYRGPNPYDAGLFYCPYVPLTMVRAISENDFQPRIGFKTRYGMVANPFAPGATNGGMGTPGANPYFRTFEVTSINQQVIEEG